MTTHQYICIGSFEQNTGSIYVSDPSYSPTSKHFLGIASEIKNVKPGTYYAVIEVIKAEKRNSALFIFHEDYFPAKKGVLSGKVFNEIFDQFKFKKASSGWGIGVDAGMAGFYDKKFFIEISNEDEWYLPIAENMFKSSRRATVLDHGVISESGYGDGMYDYYVAKADRKSVAAFISFIKE
jgi:hypothetical protein